MSTEENLREFENESERVRSIVRDRSHLMWEYLLAAELLDSRLTSIADQYSALDSGKGIKRIDLTDEKKFNHWFLSLCDELPAIASNFGNVITKVDLPKAFGPPGKPGDAIKIKHAVEKIISLCDQLLAIETDIRSIDPPNRFIRLKSKMKGLTFSFFKVIVRFKDDLRERANELTGPNPRSDYTFNLNFETPQQVVQIKKEINKIKSNLPVHTKTMSYSEMRQILYGDLQIPVSESQIKRSTKSNVRNTISIVNRFFRIFR